MRKLVIALAGTALSMTGGALSAENSATPKGEAKLQKMIEGHVAGEPTRCINMTGRDGLQIVDRTAVIFKSGDTIYVGRPLHPSVLRKEGSLAVVRSNSMRVCTDDSIVAVHSRGIGRQVQLAEFVPYTKPKG